MCIDVFSKASGYLVACASFTTNNVKHFLFSFLFTRHFGWLLMHGNTIIDCVASEFDDTFDLRSQMTHNFLDAFWLTLNLLVRRAQWLACQSATTSGNVSDMWIDMFTFRRIGEFAVIHSVHCIQPVQPDCSCVPLFAWVALCVAIKPP